MIEKLKEEKIHCVSLWVRMHVCTYVCECASVCICDVCAHTCVSMPVSMWVCMTAWAYMCECMCMHVCTHARKCACVNLCTCACVCTHLFIMHVCEYLCE